MLLQLNLKPILENTWNLPLLKTSSLQKWKNIARLTNPSVDKLAVLDHLVGIVPEDTVGDEKILKEERLARQ
mgnify:CR=1 FL=1